MHATQSIDSAPASSQQTPQLEPFPRKEDEIVKKLAVSSIAALGILTSPYFLAIGTVAGLIAGDLGYNLIDPYTKHLDRVLLITAVAVGILSALLITYASFLVYPAAALAGFYVGSTLANELRRHLAPRVSS